MRSGVSPSYTTNIFMGLFKGTFIYSFHKQPLIVYLRYIDDVLRLWHYNEKSFNEFFNHTNMCHDSTNLLFITQNRLLTTVDETQWAPTYIGPHGNCGLI